MNYRRRMGWRGKIFRIGVRFPVLLFDLGSRLLKEPFCAISLDHGNNDPVAQKILGKLAMESGLAPPPDENIVSLVSFYFFFFFFSDGDNDQPLLLFSDLTLRHVPPCHSYRRPNS